MANSISAGTQTICWESKKRETQSLRTHFLLHELEQFHHDKAERKIPARWIRKHTNVFML